MFGLEIRVGLGLRNPNRLTEQHFSVSKHCLMNMSDESIEVNIL